jgi:hypothetical protein
MMPSDFPKASEIYVIENSIEVAVTINGQDERIRIDALNQGGSYSTRSYIEKHLVVQPAYPQGKCGTLPQTEVVTQWVPYDLPWTNRNSSDDALRQALSFLDERCS